MLPLGAPERVNTSICSAIANAARPREGADRDAQPARDEHHDQADERVLRLAQEDPRGEPLSAIELIAELDSTMTNRARRQTRRTRL